MKKYLPVIICFVVGFLIGFFHDRIGRRNRPEPTIIRDTVTCTIFDTIVHEKPVPVYSYIHDTIRTHFTTIEHDTVTVDVPIETKVYEEDSLYRAVVSGWRCSLDSLLVYQKTTEITITNTVKIPPKKFAFGVAAGPSILATPSGKVYGGLGATVGVTYRF